MPVSRNSKAVPNSEAGAAIAVAALAALIGGAALLFFFLNGSTLYFGDAQAHIDIARRVIDTRTPSGEQIGTVWLPLPHLLMIPLVWHPALWRNGLAGAIPSSAAFVAAAVFLFLAARRTLGHAPAFAAAGLFALNPNMLYLQSAPMTEALFAATLAALLYFTLRFRQTQELRAAALAGAAACAATLTRYEGWFLLPFVSLYILVTARRKRFLAAALFASIAAVGPLAWLAHNWWYWGDALEFYRGPYSPRAIQRGLPYPGYRDWSLAWLQYRTAIRLCVGSPLCWLAAAGAAAAAAKRVFWPLFLLALPPAFYVWSMQSSGGSPLFVPVLWPFSHYNTRYAIAALPLLAFAAASLVAVVTPRLRAPAALVIVAAAVAPWILHPKSDDWVVWKESQVNSIARRAWTAQAAAFLQPRYRRGSGIFTSFGDMAGIYALAGIPLRETLTGDNMPQWEATVRRPDLFLWEEWAVTASGDRVEGAMQHARGYELVREIRVPGAPAIRIYHRSAPNPAVPYDSATRGTP
jgi:hypothetical protein